jgi:hypothetical protein
VRAHSEYANFTLNSNIALEISLKDQFKDTGYNLDLRELYLSWYPSFWELRFGKQINSWGVGSTNSPMDILNPINYYYFFSKGIEKNIGNLSFAVDSYLSGYQLGLVYLIGHNSNLLPIDDPEMPINIESLPTDLKIQEIDSPSQFGLYLKKPFNNTDITISYFKGYDNLITLFGANLWNDSITENLDGAYIDTVLSYRATNASALSISTFINDTRINSELVYFKTEDNIGTDTDIERPFNGKIDQICDSNSDFFDFQNSQCEEALVGQYGLGTKAEYMEFLFEFEYPDLFYNISFIGQFLHYRLLSIERGLHPDPIDLQVGTVDLTTKNNFIPALGSPIFMFTMHEDQETGTLYLHESSVLYLNAKRFFFNQTLETNFRTFWDLDNSGNLFEIELKYSYSDNINLGIAVNKITGNNDLDGSYMFNAMENFSHIRMELKYNF